MAVGRSVGLIDRAGVRAFVDATLLEPQLAQACDCL
jgi:hypothetical protein